MRLAIVCRSRDIFSVVPRSVLKLTVGSDHRVVNGAENARYLAEVKRLLEHPLLLTV